METIKEGRELHCSRGANLLAKQLVFEEVKEDTTSGRLNDW